MPRYLTAPKICLLLLAEIYLADAIPSKDKLDLLAFIASQTTPSSVDQDECDLELSTSTLFLTRDISAFAEKLGPCQSAVPGRSLYDIFLQRLWTLDGLDSLYFLFEQLNRLVATPPSSGETGTVGKVSRASPLGLYIRRCSVEFTRLQFADAQSLWVELNRYRASSFPTWAERNPESVRERQRRLDIIDHVASDATAGAVEGADHIGRVFASTDDVSKLLNLSINHLQNTGGRVPPTVRSRLKEWFELQAEAPDDSSTSAATLPKAASNEPLQHFLAFFEHWRAGQYTSALESLHRYFDYSLIDERTETAAPTSGLKTYYQYALLHLSVLHSDFECWAEAVEALEECIAIARENGDTSCLNSALSWYLGLLHSHPPDSQTSSLAKVTELIGGDGKANDVEVIRFLKAKAREGRIWSLLSGTLLEEARSELYASGSSAKANENILQSAYVNMMHGLTDMMPSTLMFQAAACERLNLNDWANKVFHSLSILHGGHLSLTDRISAISRLSHYLSLSGQYGRAEKLFDEAAEGVQGVLKLQQKLQGFRGIVAVRKYLHRDDLEAASYILEQLRPIRSNYANPEIYYEIRGLEIDLLIRKGDYESALDAVNAQIKATKDTRAPIDLAQRVHLLLQKSKIWGHAGRAVSGFSLALRAVSTAQSHNLVAELVEALVVLSNILNELREFEVANNLIMSALPFALEGSDVMIQAELYERLADAHVGIATQICPAGSKEQAASMAEAASAVEKSYQAYAAIQDLCGMLNCLTMKATLARWHNDPLSASKADDMFDQVLADSEAEHAQR